MYKYKYIIYSAYHTGKFMTNKYPMSLETEQLDKKR